MLGVFMNYQNLLDQLREHEGLRLKPYRCTEGKLTIGYGRNLEDNGISEEEADHLLFNDVANVETALARHRLLGEEHCDARRAVITNMAFQLGVNGLLGFKKAIAAYRKSQYLTCSIEMLDSLWASEKQTPERAKQLAEQMRTGEWQ